MRKKGELAETIHHEFLLNLSVCLEQLMNHTFTPRFTMRRYTVSPNVL